MSKYNILPTITSEDISRYPDQASFKINSIISSLYDEITDREKGDETGGDALQAEKQARINADTALGERITNEANTRASDDAALSTRIDNIVGAMYPVGTVYKTTSSADPATILGSGTWARINDYELVAYATLSSDTTIAASKNISSVVKTSAGHYKVTLSKNMANDKYLVYISGDVAIEGSEIIGIYSKTVNTFTYDFTDHTGAAATPGLVDIAIFGQLATPEIYTWKRTA